MVNYCPLWFDTSIDLLTRFVAQEIFRLNLTSINEDQFKKLVEFTNHSEINVARSINKLIDLEVIKGKKYKYKELEPKKKKNKTKISVVNSSTNRQRNLIPVVKEKFESVIEKNREGYLNSFTQEQIDSAKNMIVYGIDNFKKKTLLAQLSPDEIRKIIYKTLQMIQHNIRSDLMRNAMMEEFKKCAKNHVNKRNKTRKMVIEDDEIAEKIKKSKYKKKALKRELKNLYKENQPGW